MGKVEDEKCLKYDLVQSFDLSESTGEESGPLAKTLVKKLATVP